MDAAQYACGIIKTDGQHAPTAGPKHSLHIEGAALASLPVEYIVDFPEAFTRFIRLFTLPTPSILVIRDISGKPIEDQFDD